MRSQSLPPVRFVGRSQERSRLAEEFNRAAETYSFGIGTITGVAKDWAFTENGLPKPRKKIELALSLLHSHARSSRALQGTATRELALLRRPHKLRAARFRGTLKFMLLYSALPSRIASS
jgi:hypothetical protein